MIGRSGMALAATRSAHMIAIVATNVPTSFEIEYTTTIISARLDETYGLGAFPLARAGACHAERTPRPRVGRASPVVATLTSRRLLATYRSSSQGFVCQPEAQCKAGVENAGREPGIHHGMVPHN